MIGTKAFAYLFFIFSSIRQPFVISFPGPYITMDLSYSYIEASCLYFTYVTDLGDISPPCSVQIV